MKYGYRTKDYDGLHNMYKKTRSEGFGPEVKRRIMLGSFVLSSGYYDAYYLKALRTKALIKKEFDRAFRNYDIILGPAAPTTASAFSMAFSVAVLVALYDSRSEDMVEVTDEVSTFSRVCPFVTLSPSLTLSVST